MVLNAPYLPPRTPSVPGPTGEERDICHWMNNGGSFGGKPLKLHFGLGRADEAKRVEVFWPVTGRTQTLENVAGGRTVTIEK